MRFIKFLLVLVLLLAAVFVVGGMLLPDRVHVERGITIERPAANVFAVLNSFKRFNDWSPWAPKDPDATYAYSGPERGVGARMQWSGDPETVGSGSQEITLSEPDRRIETALDFGEHGTANASFTLTPQEGGATRVVWGLDIDNQGSYVGRWFGLLMDRMLGPDYETGLKQLKAMMESTPTADIAGLAPEQFELAPMPLLYVSLEGDVSDSAAIGAQMGAAYGEIIALMQAQAVTQAGQPVSLTSAIDGTRWSYDAGIPVDRNEVELSGNVKAGVSPSGKALRFVHTGPYEGLAAFGQKVDAWLALNGYTRRDREMDQYVSDPAETPPEQIVTHVIVPVD